MCTSVYLMTETIIVTDVLNINVFVLARTRANLRGHVKFANRKSKNDEKNDKQGEEMEKKLDCQSVIGSADCTHRGILMFYVSASCRWGWGRGRGRASREPGDWHLTIDWTQK